MVLYFSFLHLVSSSILSTRFYLLHFRKKRSSLSQLSRFVPFNFFTIYRFFRLLLFYQRNWRQMVNCVWYSFPSSWTVSFGLTTMMLISLYFSYVLVNNAAYLLLLILQFCHNNDSSTLTENIINIMANNFKSKSVTCHVTNANEFFDGISFICTTSTLHRIKTK